jgi:N-acetylmuramoyl-L-alanine amidase
MAAHVVHPILWLAINTWMEARGEPYLGKLAVAYTTANRAKDPQWPEGITDVIWQGYQFSWTNPADPNRMKLDDIDMDDPVFGECLKAATDAYYGLAPDPSRGATHYLNKTAVLNESGKLPGWWANLTELVVIGKHAFAGKPKTGA